MSFQLESKQIVHNLNFQLLQTIEQTLRIAMICMLVLLSIEFRVAQLRHFTIWLKKDQRPSLTTQDD